MGAGYHGLCVRRIQFWARTAPRLAQLVQAGVLDEAGWRTVVEALTAVVPPFDSETWEGL